MKKIIFILTIILFPIIIEAKVYDVELITNETELNNSTKDNYIIVGKDSEDKYYAWVNKALEGDNTNQTQSKNNAAIVTFNKDFSKLEINDDSEILWTFGISSNSIAQNLNSYVLIGSKTLFSNDKNQIVFSDTTTSSKSPTGFNYRTNAYPLEVEFIDKEGNVILSQKDLSSNNKTHWVSFSTTNKRFLTTLSKNESQELKIYRIKEAYKKVIGYQVPNQKTIFSKTKIKDKTYSKTGIYQIDLTLQANKIKKDTDVLLILDISNSMDNNNKINKLTASANYISEEILKLNTNNRIGIVKFADGNAFEEESLELGLSNNLEEIKKLIAKEAISKLGGTNYTDAFLLAHKILESNSKNGRDQIVIFVTDGAPTIYNRTKFSVFKNTADGEIGSYATNWTNYFLNNELYPVEKMKDAGISIITIGVDVDQDMPLKTDGSFVIKAKDAQTILKNIATTESDFYQVNDYDNLEATFEKVKLNLENKMIYKSITDNIETGYKLFTTTLAGKIPYIEIKNESGKIIEKINFSEDGLKAYSSINPNQNIMVKTEQGLVLGASTFNYDFNTKILSWNAENISDDKVTFTYFIIPETENPNTKDLSIIISFITIIISLIIIKTLYKKINWLK